MANLQAKVLFTCLLRISYVSSQVFVLIEDGKAQGIPRQQWPQCRQVGLIMFVGWIEKEILPS
jgi:hypothetical protein